MKAYFVKLYLIVLGIFIIIFKWIWKFYHVEIYIKNLKIHYVENGRIDFLVMIVELLGFLNFTKVSQKLNTKFENAKIRYII